MPLAFRSTTFQSWIFFSHPVPHFNLVKFCSTFVHTVLICPGNRGSNIYLLYFSSFFACRVSESRHESGSTITRRPSKARAFVNKFFRSSMRVINSPSVASPVEIQERFLYIINEAVVLATLFSKSTIVCESNLFGRVLQQLSSAGDARTDANPLTQSQDADMVFSSGLLSYLIEAVHICLVSEQ